MIGTKISIVFLQNYISSSLELHITTQDLTPLTPYYPKLFTSSVSSLSTLEVFILSSVTLQTFLELLPIVELINIIFKIDNKHRLLCSLNHGDKDTTFSVQRSY